MILSGGRLHRVRCWDKFAQTICKVTQAAAAAASLRNINELKKESYKKKNIFISRTHNI